MTTSSARLAQIAALIEPCPPPDVLAGYDMCSHGQAWPCPVTKAAWLARGSDRATEMATWRAAIQREAQLQAAIDETRRDHQAAIAAGREDEWLAEL